MSITTDKDARFKDEISNLWEEVKELRENADHWMSRKEELQRENARLNCKIDDLESEIRRQKN